MNTHKTKRKVSQANTCILFGLDEVGFLRKNHKTQTATTISLAEETQLTTTNSQQKKYKINMKKKLFVVV
jgi:hypothetical protein